MRYLPHELVQHLSNYDTLVWNETLNWKEFGSPSTYFVDGNGRLIRDSTMDVCLPKETLGLFHHVSPQGSWTTLRVHHNQNHGNKIEKIGHRHEGIKKNYIVFPATWGPLFWKKIWWIRKSPFNKYLYNPSSNPNLLIVKVMWKKHVWAKSAKCTCFFATRKIRLTKNWTQQVNTPGNSFLDGPDFLHHFGFVLPLLEAPSPRVIPPLQLTMRRGCLSRRDLLSPCHVNLRGSGIGDIFLSDYYLGDTPFKDYLKPKQGWQK